MDPTVESVRRQQRQQVRSACAAVLVAGGILAAFLASYFGLGHWLDIATIGRSGAGVLRIARPGDAATPLTWIALFTMISLVAALNVKTTARAILNVAIVLAVAGAATYGWCYRSFVALRAGSGRQVELVFLWPRPNVVADARAMTVAVESEVSPGEQFSGMVDCLKIVVNGREYRSECTGDVTTLQRFLFSRGAVAGR